MYVTRNMENGRRRELLTGSDPQAGRPGVPRGPRTSCGEHPVRCSQRPGPPPTAVTFHPADQRGDHQGSEGQPARGGRREAFTGGELLGGLCKGGED